MYVQPLITSLRTFPLSSARNAAASEALSSEATAKIAALPTNTEEESQEQHRQAFSVPVVDTDEQTAPFSEKSIENNGGNAISASPLPVLVSTLETSIIPEEANDNSHILGARARAITSYNTIQIHNNALTVVPQQVNISL